MGWFARVLGGEKNLPQPLDRGRVWNTIMEPFGGAWQHNVEIKRDQVLAYSAVYACITRIAADISKLEIRLVRKVKGIWQEQENPAYSPVLRKPNAFQNRIQFFQHWVASKLAHGNVYVLKSRDSRGVVVGLYVLDPMRVRVLVSDFGDVFYELKRDTLSGLQEETIVVPAREVIHDRMNALYHPLIGLSPIYACGLAATAGFNAQTTSAAFFGNGARPGGVLTAPGQINQETADRLKEYWDGNFTGSKAGRVAVLGDGLKYEPLMMNATDAQLIEQLRWSAETVAGCFHVPYYKVGGPPPAYNNIEALNVQYYSDCLQELIESIELCLDEGLELKKGYGTEFNLDDLLRMDTATLVKTYGDATLRGLAVNEFRRKLNLPAVEGGDEPLMQEQNWPISELAKRDLSQTEPPPPPPAPVAEDAEQRAWLAEALFEAQKGLAA